jgi:hypothetical protein
MNTTPLIINLPMPLDHIELLTCWEEFGIQGNSHQCFVQQTADLKNPEHKYHHFTSLQQLNDHACLSINDIIQLLFALLSQTYVFSDRHHSKEIQYDVLAHGQRSFRIIQNIIRCNRLMISYITKLTDNVRQNEFKFRKFFIHSQIGLERIT